NEIVKFSELERFIDTPIKHYSTGMWVRLGFAVAAHMEPEILLVDEVLSAGDAAFQKKCLGKIDEATGQGRTVLIVSHNLKAITDLCERCLWIDHGRIIRSGGTQEVIVAYLESTQPQRTSGRIEPDMHENPNADALFCQVTIVNATDQHVTKIFFGETLRIMIQFEVVRPVSELRIAAGLERHQDGITVAMCTTMMTPRRLFIIYSRAYTRCKSKRKYPFRRAGIQLIWKRNPVQASRELEGTGTWFAEQSISTLRNSPSKAKEFLALMASLGHLQNGG